MGTIRMLFVCVIIVFQSFAYSKVLAQPIKLGAYYFDGWTGRSAFHLGKKLVDSFPERQPIWGWKTSTPVLLDKQIDLAAEAGISFFSFCWYFKKYPDSLSVDADEKNNALKLYLNSKNKSKIEFNLLVANHAGYEIEAEDWHKLCLYWCKLFQEPTYLKVDGKPLITFFDIRALYATFKTKEKLKEALDELRNLAKKNGLPGVTIAVNVANAERAGVAERSGFDVMTGYNYHGNGLKDKTNREVVPIDQMRTMEPKIWGEITEFNSKPIIPTITLNWDRRPLDNRKVLRSPRFSGFSENSVKSAVVNCKKWINNNLNHVTKERIAVIYAWNEYGEGAWLTPSAKLKNSLLEGVKAGLADK